MNLLLAIIVLLLIFSLPTWPYSSGWGYYPSSGLGDRSVDSLDPVPRATSGLTMNDGRLPSGVRAMAYRIGAP